MQDNEIIVKESNIEEAIKVSKTILEWDEDYSKEYYEKRIKGKERCILVAYKNTEPVGYMISYDKYNDGSFYCWMTGVKPRYRKQGALKLMMLYLENWAKSNNYNKIKIKTRNNRRGMLNYLVNNGFNIIEVIPYNKADDSRILFEKEI